MTKSATLPPFSPTILLGILTSPLPSSFLTRFYEKLAQHITAHTPHIETMLSTLSGQSLLIVPSDMPSNILITFSAQHLQIESVAENTHQQTTTIYGNYHALIAFFDTIILAENDTQQHVPLDITIEGNEKPLITFFRSINKTSAEFTEEIFDGLGLSGVLLSYYLRPKKIILDSLHQHMQAFQAAFSAPIEDKTEEQNQRISQLSQKMQQLEKTIKKQASYIEELRQSKK